MVPAGGELEKSYLATLTGCRKRDIVNKRLSANRKFYNVEKFFNIHFDLIPCVFDLRFCLPLQKIEKRIGRKKNSGQLRN